MGDVRPLTAADVEVLAPIHAAAFGEIGTTRDRIERGYTTKLGELVLDGPFADRVSPSLVYEHDGRIVGFVVVTARPASFRGDRVWMATSTHLAVEPEARASLAGVHLLRAVTDGPQDLTFVDRSNAAGRLALRAAGFEQLPAHSLRWHKTLRPAAALAERVGSRLPFRTGLAETISDRLSQRLPGPLGRRSRTDLPLRPGAMTSRPLTVDDVVDAGPTLLDAYELRPDLGDRELVEHDWGLVEATCPGSRIVRTALTTRRGDVVAWYVAEIGRSGPSTAVVLQLVADPRHQLAAMTFMFHDLLDLGVTRAEGHLPLGLLFDAEDLGCEPTSADSTASVHSARAELVDAYRRDAAWFSDVDGELLDLPAAVEP